MNSSDIKRHVKRRLERFKRTAPEQPVSYNRAFPHCDPRVVHFPGRCGYCDARPDLQDLVMAWGLGWAGEDHAPYLSTRSHESVEAWPGNRPEGYLRPFDAALNDLSSDAWAEPVRVGIPRDRARPL